MSPSTTRWDALAGRRGKAASTTRRDLVRLRAALLVLIVVTAAFSSLSFYRVHTAVPAAVEVFAAREALVEAHRGAVGSIRSGEVMLAGPGSEYRTQLAIAQRHLTKVVETGVSVPDDDQRLEVVQGLLASYIADVHLAATNFREDPSSLLGTAYLWNASLLLDREGEGIVHQLDLLRGEYLLAARASVGITLLWAVPAVLLIALLCGGQVLLARRFRRIVNPALASATLCALGLVGVASRTLWTRGELDRLAAQWAELVAASGRRERDEVQAVLRRLCEPRDGGCGVTVQHWVATTPHPGDVVAADFPIAGAGLGWLWVMALLAGLAAVLVVVGLSLRLDEYRYRVR